jgi:BASS family bile acid:Na+ symporter
VVADLDAVRLNFNANTMFFMKFALGLIMLGVALDINPKDLKKSFKQPKSITAGLVGQFLFLPALTYCLVLILEPKASIALGMMLVAACPGGNFSNLFTLLARGNTALSVSLTFMATILALIMTPFNITFWGNLYPPTRELVQRIELNPKEIALTVIIVLGLPLVIGMIIRARNILFANKLQNFLKKFSVIFIVIVVLGAFVTNFDTFKTYIQYIVFIVFLQNVIALGTGFITGTLLKVSNKDRRAITLEIGIQNSGLGLALAFEFFSQLGGVALVCAWWGIWHAISGSLVAHLFSRKDKSQIVYEK